MNYHHCHFILETECTVKTQICTHSLISSYKCSATKFKQHENLERIFGHSVIYIFKFPSMADVYSYVVVVAVAVAVAAAVVVVVVAAAAAAAAAAAVAAAVVVVVVVVAAAVIFRSFVLVLDL